MVATILTIDAVVLWDRAVLSEKSVMGESRNECVGRETMSGNRRCRDSVQRIPNEAVLLSRCRVAV